jgi:hypothetical protein
MAGVLDSSRMKYFLSDALNVSINDVETFVLGGHGDDMVPLVNYTTIGGIPLMEYIKMKKIPISKIQKIVSKAFKKRFFFLCPSKFSDSDGRSVSAKSKKTLTLCCFYQWSVWT